MFWEYEIWGTGGILGFGEEIYTTKFRFPQFIPFHKLFPLSHLPTLTSSSLSHHSSLYLLLTLYPDAANIQIRLVYNKYISAISYEPGVNKVITAAALRSAAGFQAYEMEEDSSNDLAEFALANAIYTALVEGHAAEISARRTAMENASNVSEAFHLRYRCLGNERLGTRRVDLDKLGRDYRDKGHHLDLIQETNNRIEHYADIRRTP